LVDFVIFDVLWLPLFNAAGKSLDRPQAKSQCLPSFPNGRWNYAEIKERLTIKFFFRGIPVTLILVEDRRESGEELAPLNMLAISARLNGMVHLAISIRDIQLGLFKNQPIRWLPKNVQYLASTV
jgi:hypothetical protein